MNLLLVNSSPVKNGATAEIIKQIKQCTPNTYSIKDICIDDYTINFCIGCKLCYNFKYRLSIAGGL